MNRIAHMGRRASIIQDLASLCRLSFLIVGILLAAFSFTRLAFASIETNPLHWSGIKTKWDRKKNIVTLRGLATVHKPGESLSADTIVLDLDKRTVKARGNCVYSTQEMLIRSEALSFHLDTSIGVIIGGTITNGKFELKGERINKLGPKRYQTHRGQYTTCHDCPSAWSIEGEDVDFEFGGYAFMSNVNFRVKDAYVMWFPYLIVPLKSERETGFLFPSFSATSTDGFRFIQPFFWAINRSADMTFGGGGYTNRGGRAEWEGRYALGSRSSGNLNLFYQRDNSVNAPFSSTGTANDDGSTTTTKVDGTDVRNRWSIALRQKQELPFSIRQRLEFFEVSDQLYPGELTRNDTDVPGAFLPNLESKLSFTHLGVHHSAFLDFQRHRDLLYFEDPTRFDPETVQVVPRFEFNFNDQSPFDFPFAVGARFGVTNFGRVSGDFDSNPDGEFDSIEPGVDPIRKAVRFQYSPRIYFPLRPFNAFSLVPSVRYQGYHYIFPDDRVPKLTRGYVLAQSELRTDFSRIYDTSNPAIPKVKHTVSPFVRYNWIPLINEPEDNPFVQQTTVNKGFRFDNLDVVPLDPPKTIDNYFIPLGNSVTYGVNTSFIQRFGAIGAPATYRKFLEFRAQQTLNIRELTREVTADFSDNDRIPLSRLETLSTLTLDHFQVSVDYKYYPFLERYEELQGNTDALKIPHTVNTSFTFIDRREVIENIFQIDRSLSFQFGYSAIVTESANLGASVAWSLNDYILPKAGASIDLTQPELQSFNSSLLFQSASRCWRIELLFSYSFIESIGTGFEPLITLNFTSEGFSSFEGFASQAIGRN